MKKRKNDKSPNTWVHEDLEQAIRNLHGCESAWVKKVPVTEVFDGDVVWEGVVHVFELHGHPSATRCYAWSHPIEGSTKHKYFAVLHAGPVDSPQAAVRAAIVAEHRK